MGGRYPSSILEFQRQFPDEAACRRYLLDARWPDGFRCERCGGPDAIELPARGLWRCSGCRAETSLTAGTVMHKTRLPLTVWFWAAYLVATHGPGISAVQLQRQLGLSRHETAWTMLHKLRRAMMNPLREPLSGEVEVDEAFIGGRDRGRRGGRQKDGSKSLVIVAVEARGDAGSGRLRMRVIPDASADTLCGFVTQVVERGSVVHTDGWPGYKRLGSLSFDHQPLSQLQHEEMLLPHAHRAISNLKTWLRGTYHGVSASKLPTYLDEYVFRHNRRDTPMAAFQTLLGLAAHHKPTTRREIIDTPTCSASWS
jgi:transposase-like protein